MKVFWLVYDFVLGAGFSWIGIATGHPITAMSGGLLLGLGAGLVVSWKEV